VVRAKRSDGRHAAVIVAMRAVGMVQVTANEIVDVIAVR
jgi:hypothetical protein